MGKELSLQVVNTRSRDYWRLLFSTFRLLTGTTTKSCLQLRTKTATEKSRQRGRKKKLTRKNERKQTNRQNTLHPANFCCCCWLRRFRKRVFKSRRTLCRKVHIKWTDTHPCPCVHRVFRVISPRVQYTNGDKEFWGQGPVSGSNPHRKQRM